jgi:RimK family alpha-L-glutamate ligase
LKIGLLTRNAGSWCSRHLVEAIRKRAEPVCFWFNDLVARVGSVPEIVLADGGHLPASMRRILVRPIGRGSLDQIIFRLDLLHRFERNGVYVVNPAASIEKAVNKYYALSLLNEAGIAVPRTVVTESSTGSLSAFKHLGSDVVVKPLFGSMGRGICRVEDMEVGRRIFSALEYNRSVLYQQQYVDHGNSDLRLLVVGDRVVAAMRRRGSDWRSNISRGAKPSPFKPDSELTELALKAARTLGCVVAGVDIMDDGDHYLVAELNSQPGFRGLQSVTKINIADAIIAELVNSDSQKGS